jgi:hypothetical protein
VYVTSLGLTQVHSSAESGGAVTETVASFFPVAGKEIGKALHWVMDTVEKYGGPQGYVVPTAEEGAALASRINPCNPPPERKGEPPFSVQQRAQWKQDCAIQRAQYASVAGKILTIQQQQELLSTTAVEPWYTQTRYYVYAAVALVAGAAVIGAVRKA